MPYDVQRASRVSSQSSFFDGIEMLGRGCGIEQSGRIGYSQDSKGLSVLGIFRSAGSAARKRKSEQASSRKAKDRPSRVKGSWWFVPVQSTPPKTIRVRLNRTLLDEMAAISATPIGVEDIEVAVGVEGLRQDWSRVGGYLRTAMDGLEVDPPNPRS